MSYRKQMRDIAKTFNCKVSIAKHGTKFAGCFKRKERKLLINTYHTDGRGVDYVWSVFFHELAHQFCYDSSIYPTYYKTRIPLMTYKRIALKAEKETDRIGKQLMKLYFPDMKYTEWYLSIDRYKWKRKWWNNFLASKG